MQAGQVQVGIINTDSATIAIGKGTPIVIIAALRSPFEIVVYVNSYSNITKLDQLKGKTFGASNPGSFQDIAVKIIASMMNWTIGKDIKVAYLRTNDAAFSALASGKVDAVASTYLDGFPYVKKGAIKPIFTTYEKWPGWVLVSTTSYIQQNPDVIRAILKPFSEGHYYILIQKIP
jgi:ABC-type nitrate/sulfonate/bicarbonate transport system substrate-binding protein